MLFQNVKIKDVKLNYGLWVKTLRKREKLSQQELANLLNLSRITIQNSEAGKNFTIDTLLIVLAHFDVLNTLNKEILHHISDAKSVKSLY